MALAKCKERGNEVKQQTDAGKMLGGLGVLLVGALITWGCASDNSVKHVSDTANQAQSCSTDDLQCLGDKGTVAASIYCKAPIERLATHIVKWTGGTFETKFSFFRWTDHPGGPITFIGDKAEFRNDVGVYTPVIYQCDLAGDDKTVLAVRATAGRLPP
jgi:hypothetical protein